MRAIGAVVAALAFAGCGTAAQSAVRDATETRQQVACSFADDYKSLAQLRRDAASVAVVSPTGAVRRRVVSRIPMEDATVRVIQLVTGKRLPATFTLLDVAGPKLDGSENCSPTISKGNAYLVYLMPLPRGRHRRPGAPRFWGVG